MTFAAVTGTAGVPAARFAPPLARVPEQAESRSWLINSPTRLTAVRELMQEMRWEIPPGKCFIALLLYGNRARWEILASFIYCAAKARMQAGSG
jgi:hypothetical protein